MALRYVCSVKWGAPKFVIIIAVKLNKDQKVVPGGKGGNCWATEPKRSQDVILSHYFSISAWSYESFFLVDAH